MRAALLSGVTLATLLAGCGGGSPASPTPTSATVAPSATVGPSSSATPPVYPPVTVADLHALAGIGVDSDVTVLPSPSAGATGSCPTFTFVTITLRSGISPEQQIADMTRLFFARHLDQGCGGAVNAFLDPSHIGAPMADATVSLFVGPPRSIKLFPVIGELVTIPAG